MTDSLFADNEEREKGPKRTSIDSASRGDVKTKTIQTSPVVNDLLWLAYTGNYSEVKRLITLRANPNVVNLNNTTPLMYAAQIGRIEIVRVLLDAGADAKLIDNEGKTAQDYAGESGNEHVVNLIKSALQGTLRNAS